MNPSMTNSDTRPMMTGNFTSAAVEEEPGETGVVVLKTTGKAVVQVGERRVSCDVSNRLRKQLIYSAAGANPGHRSVQAVKELAHEDPLAVGDQVRFTPSGADAGLITAVLPRRTQMTRRSAVPMPGAHAFEQVIAANLDQVAPVFAAAQPAPKWGLLDRYLVSAEASGLQALVCITKIDLATGKDGQIDPELLAAVESYRRIGYPVVLTSAATGQGLDELWAALRGKITALVGKSGVGKTTLLNALLPGLGKRVSQVSQTTGKGRHTTTHMEMVALDGPGMTGGALIDTPGIREFGLWQAAGEDLALYFPELRDLVGRCRFGLDCRHDEEPGCAIRKAVMAGEVSPERYRSLLKLQEEAG